MVTKEQHDFIIDCIHQFSQQIFLVLRNQSEKTIGQLACFCLGYICHFMYFKLELCVAAIFICSCIWLVQTWHCQDVQTKMIIATVAISWVWFFFFLIYAECAIEESRRFHLLRKRDRGWAGKPRKCSRWKNPDSCKSRWGCSTSIGLLSWSNGRVASLQVVEGSRFFLSLQTWLLQTAL